MTVATQSIDQLCINAIRFLAMDGVEKAKSGHPGLPMGCAPMAYTLWDKFMRFNPKNPNWINRDRFVVSNGHGSMLLYSLLHLSGYDVSINDMFLKQLDLVTEQTKKISEIDIDFLPQKEFLEDQFKALYKLAEQTDKSDFSTEKRQEQSCRGKLIEPRKRDP